MDELIERKTMRDRLRWKFMRDKIMLYMLKQCPNESAEIMATDVFYGILDELDEKGFPITERCVEHPIYQRALKDWGAFQQKRRQDIMENRSL